LTQQEAADRVLWSLSKIIRVENGPSAPTPADARVLMLEYGAPEERVAEVVDIAQKARRPNRWDTYKSVFSNESRSLFANEPAASLIQKHEPSLVPGLLQTEDYARALLVGLDVPSAKIEQVVKGRLERQEILESEGGPRLNFVLGEAAVSRPIGGHAVMRSQIERLKELARRPDTTLRLMPFSAGPYPGMGVAFTILEFRDPELSDLLYLESGDRETVVREDVDEVESYLSRFARIQELASSPQAFAGLLDAIVKNRFDG
jgi:hypothetical protein